MHFYSIKKSLKNSDSLTLFFFTDTSKGKDGPVNDVPVASKFPRVLLNRIKMEPTAVVDEQTAVVDEPTADNDIANFSPEDPLSFEAWNKGNFLEIN